jgi:Xaa-Pro aminopeptidase
MRVRFGPEFFRDNRERLRSLFTGTAPIVIGAHGTLQQSADSAYPFTQDKNFWYLTGLDIPDAVLVLDKLKEYIILPERPEWQVVFDGQTSEEAAQNLSGIQTIFSNKEGWRQLESRIKKVKHIASLLPADPYVSHHGFYVNPARQNLMRRVSAINSAIQPLDLRAQLAAMRMIKQPAELDAIKEAIAVTGGTIKKLLRKDLTSFSSEFDIETEIIRSFRKRSASTAFESIVAAGSSACTIHHLPTKQPLDVSGLILFDIGAAVDGYSADISRTIPLGKNNKTYASSICSRHRSV